MELHMIPAMTVSQLIENLSQLPQGTQIAFAVMDNSPAGYAWIYPTNLATTHYDGLAVMAFLPEVDCEEDLEEIVGPEIYTGLFDGSEYDEGERPDADTHRNEPR